MKKLSDPYYEIFEKMQIAHNSGNVFDKVSKLIMIFYKLLYNTINLKNIKKRIEGQEDIKYLELRQFKDIHKGKRCFVICTGPSLTVDDVNKLSGEYTFGMNSITKLFDKTGWRPTYYAISDALVYNKLKNDKNFKEIKGKFIANDIAKVERVESEDIVYYVDGYEFFKYGHATNFSDNAYARVFAGGTVTYDILQLAVYMGFNEIYLLGCDSDYSGSKKHFSEYFDKDSKMTQTNFNIDYLFESYKIAQNYCQNHDVKIYNATRGGKLEVFPRVNFDSLFSKNR